MQGSGLPGLEPWLHSLMVTCGPPVLPEGWLRVVCGLPERSLKIP